MAEKKSKKKKIRMSGLLVILLFGYLFFSCIFYLWKMPIKDIDVEGNFYLKDNYIVSYIDIENNSIMNVSSRKIKNKLLKLDLIEKVKVSKNYLGKLKIKIKEEKILFYNWNTKMLVLGSGKEINFNKEYLGVPTLINYVPEDIYKELIIKLDKVSNNVLSLVSEIEYSPSIVNEKVVDANRFLFRMNDGNKVFINTINIEKFNNYLEIYEVVVNKNGLIKGCLYLDSNSENKTFNNCENEPVEVEDGDEEKDGEN